ncbi:MAG: hypothetical protein OXG44_19370 [Gammaproteobacteria bacterium]|nr:hypothetical protein [Gammaproteobacteria bacterium]
MKTYTPGLLLFSLFMVMGVLHSSIAVIELKSGHEPLWFIGMMVGVAMVMFSVAGMAIQSWVRR